MIYEMTYILFKSQKKWKTKKKKLFNNINRTFMET